MCGTECGLSKLICACCQILIMLFAISLCVFFFCLSFFPYVTIVDCLKLKKDNKYYFPENVGFLSLLVLILLPAVWVLAVQLV